MKTFIGLIIIGLTLVVMAGQAPKSDLEYAREEFITDLIFKGIPKERAIQAAATINPDTLLIFVNTPDCFPIRDSSGQITKDAVRRYLSNDGSRGYLEIVRSKKVIQDESNGLEHKVIFYEIESREIFKIEPALLRQKK